MFFVLDNVSEIHSYIILSVLSQIGSSKAYNSDKVIHTNIVTYTLLLVDRTN